MQKHNVQEVDKNAFENKSNKKIIFNDIKIKNVEFNYDSSVKLINDFNLDIREEKKYVLLEKVALVNPQF